MFVFIPFPLLFFVWLKPELELFPSSIVFFKRTVIALILFVLVGMIIKYATEPYLCKKCQLLIPYKEIGQKIRDIGFQNGTIIGYYFPHDLAGNLRTSFPNTSIIGTKHPNLTYDSNGPSGQCLVIWVPKPFGVMDGRGMTNFLNMHYSAQLGYDAHKETSLFFNYNRTTNRQGQLDYLFFPNGVGTCR